MNFYVLGSILLIAAAVALFLTRPAVNPEREDDREADLRSDGLFQSSDLISENPLMFLLTSELWSAGMTDDTKMGEGK